MPIEKGMTALMEDWIVTILAALQYNGEDVFKTAEPWEHQLAAKLESFGRYEPFAFVCYHPDQPLREGGYDLNQGLRFSVFFGVQSKDAGVARRGDDNHLGASKIRDLIITALDGQHPGVGFDCDELNFVYEVEWVEAQKRYAAELHFLAKWLSE